MTYSYAHFPWRFRHPLERLNAPFGFVAENVPLQDEETLVRRIVTAFRKAAATDIGSSDNMWLQFFAETNVESHRVLMEGTDAEVAALLRDPGSSFLFHGFDGPTRATVAGVGNGYAESLTAHSTYDALLSLSAAIGATRIENPEALLPGQGPDVDSLLAGIDAALGCRVEFPNLFRGDIGIASSRGVVTHRALTAVYHAWRIFELAGRNPDAHILEIGAGLGRNAFYAHAMGARHYTIIDLPTTNVAQGYFLARTLGPEAVALYGEPQPAYVRVLPPESFFGSEERYDIVANMDSMTEFSRDTARKYVDHIRRKAACFLSINHENNAFTIRELAIEAGASPRSSRMPHWMRRGYVEEVF